MKRILIAVAAVAVTYSLNCGAENGVSEKRILLGQAAVLSGPAAQLGIQMRNGIKAYFDYVNERGGVHGRKLELASEDDKYEASVAPLASRKLIEEHKVFALLGYVGTPTGAAHLPVVTQAKVPLVGMFTGAEILRVPFNRYVFHVRASYYDETEKIVSQVVPFPWGTAVPVVKEYQQLAKKAGYTDYNFSAMEGFLNAKVMVEALRRAGRNPTREGLVDALEKMQDVDLGGFYVSYSPKNHAGSKFVDLTIIGRNGKFLR